MVVLCVIALNCLSVLQNIIPISHNAFCTVSLKRRSLLNVKVKFFLKTKKTFSANLVRKTFEMAEIMIGMGDIIKGVWKFRSRKQQVPI